MIDNNDIREANKQIQANHLLDKLDKALDDEDIFSASILLTRIKNLGYKVEKQTEIKQ